MARSAIRKPTGLYWEGKSPVNRAGIGLRAGSKREVYWACRETEHAGCVRSQALHSGWHVMVEPAGPASDSSFGDGHAWCFVDQWCGSNWRFVCLPGRARKPSRVRW